MKKLTAVFLAAVIALSLTACANSGQGSEVQSGGNTETAAPTEAPAADETDAYGMRFTAPEGYETVERSLEVFADGAVSQKSFTYKFADKSEIIVGYTYGHSITEAVSQSKLDEADTVEYGGVSYTVIDEGRTRMAVNENGNDMYAVGYTFAEEIDSAQFDAFMNGVSLTGDAAPSQIDDDLFAIRYTLDSSWKLSTTNNTVVETPDGEPVKKTIGWHFGENEDNLDYRFVVRVFKNTTVAEQLSSDYEYEEQELGGITYSVIKPTNDSKPYEYFTQHGDDVYELRNNGTPDGWGVTRTEASETAFDALVNSVHFE